MGPLDGADLQLTSAYAQRPSIRVLLHPVGPTYAHKISQSIYRSARLKLTRSSATAKSTARPSCL